MKLCDVLPIIEAESVVFDRAGNELTSWLENDTKYQMDVVGIEPMSETCVAITIDCGVYRDTETDSIVFEAELKEYFDGLDDDTKYDYGFEFQNYLNYLLRERAIIRVKGENHV